MFKVSVKDSQNIETNYAFFSTTPECEAWVIENNDYFPTSYTYQITNISQQKIFEAAKNKGLRNQQAGREVLAIIYAINEEKVGLGLLNQAGLTTLLQDEGLKVIERLLLNGSLSTAKQLIINSPDTYFSAENKEVILDFINANS